MSSSRSSPLPLYLRGKMAGSRRFTEFHCMAVLLASFLLAWIALIAYMPEIQHNDVTFKGTYAKFASSLLQTEGDLSDEQVPQTVELDQALDSHSAPAATGDHMSVNRGIDSEYSGPSSDRVSRPTAPTPSDRYSPQTSEQTATDDGNDGNDQSGSTNDKRRNQVKKMIKHAWDGYVKYAFGENELQPISKQGHSAGIFGKTKMGATLVDSLDTLYISGLMDEFNQAKQWVEERFHIDEVNTDVSLFEMNIRFVGGFLSAYALSGDKMFIEKAISVVKKLLPAFNTPTGIPKSLVNLKTKATKNFKWAANGRSILSEVGSLHLEFQYLTELTNDPEYLKKVLRIRNKLRDMVGPDGLYSNYIDGENGRFAQKHISLGALGDSFYEYLIKSWLITSKNDVDGLIMFKNAISAMENKVISKKQNGLVLVNDFKGARGDGKMQHLACFSGGMYALASQHINDDISRSQHYLELAEGITGMCHESYTKTPTHLGPESFRLDSEGSVISGSNEKMYLLRPETVESYFYMWRLTHDPKYREWGWEMVQALETHCKVENGYSGLKDVFRNNPVKDNVQQSFFIAETLKYLYLLFSDDSVISLDEWVFNTEAHPLPILKGVPHIMNTTR